MFPAMVQLLDFWAEWCGPCQIMKPVVEELERELKGKVEVKSVDVDADPNEASKFGIMSIPTFVVLKNGKEVGRKIGVTSKTELMKLVNS